VSTPDTALATEIGEIVSRLRAGDATVLSEVRRLPALTPSLYAELRRVAHALLRRESPAHTLAATAVVHEAYLRIQRSANVSVNDHMHFVRLAARVMRNVLVDHARLGNAQKRGGDIDITSLDQTAMAFHTRCAEELFANDDESTPNEIDFLRLDEALEQLKAINPRQAEVVDLRFFSDLSLEETADALGVSIATVKRDWNVARVFLHRAMEA
jgi:RNA polymerase sigma-70 factor, ECF subfamily